MTDGVPLWEYRTNRSWAWAFFVPAVAGLLAAAAPIVLADGVPAWVVVLVAVLFVALAAWLVAGLRRSATIVHEDHLELRGPLRTRRVAWPDVQAIQIEHDKGAAEHDLPERIAVLYRGEGRKTWLPHVNEKEVEVLEDEVRALREVWMRERGADWAPVPAVAAKAAVKIAEDARYAMTPAMIATYAMGGSFPVVMGVFLGVGLTTDAFEGIPEDLMFYLLLGTFPAVFLAVYLTSFLRRRRRGP